MKPPIRGCGSVSPRPSLPPVLPKFKVTLELPPVVTVLDETLLLRVCGRYTYGKPVLGRVQASLCWKEQPAYHWFSSSVSLIQCMALTGQMLLKVAGSSALKNEKLRLFVSSGNKNKNKKQTFLTDESGRASFELDTSDWTGTVTLRGRFKPVARSSVYGRLSPHYPDVHRHLEPFYSKSQSFLKIRGLGGELPCDQAQQLQVDYVIAREALGNGSRSLEFIFLVVAKGAIARILHKGLDLREGAGLKGSFSVELPVGADLAPAAKVLGYTVLPDGEMAADRARLQLAKCLPNKVKLAFSQDRALPGSELQLRVQAAPGSLCAVRAVDQSVLLMKPEAELSVDTVYNLLPDFPRGDYPDAVQEPESCGPTSLVPHCHGLGPRWRCRRGISSWTPPQPDAYSLFKDAALKILTNTNAKPPCEHGLSMDLHYDAEIPYAMEAGQLHWQRKVKALPSPYGNQAPSAEVEMTAYVLLAYLSLPNVSAADMATAAQIVRWLSKQQNPYGGFASTQDTVVALQALAKYAALTYSASGAVSVTVSSQAGARQQFHVDNANRLVLQRAALQEIPGQYTVRASGEGCVFVQLILRYNVPPPKSAATFDLRVETEPKECTESATSRFSLVLHARYSGKRPATNMAIIEAKLPSGYIPVQSSLRQLEKQPLVKRLEVQKDQVTLYLDQVSAGSSGLRQPGVNGEGVSCPGFTPITAALMGSVSHARRGVAEISLGSK
ncbi:hypothetical protein KIL84_002454 [Mauremys mutica]|uniref:Alpha-2-macroglobulin-like protein 1 n=1 Tax=Mauremys mutica TaxID=74926 RepID=A0A9D3X7V7_9SAUR|nr:hypothetical protein KIL84_002454 [Mauremys mutica]